jgi:hypothetical protein
MLFFKRQYLHSDAKPHIMMPHLESTFLILSKPIPYNNFLEFDERPSTKGLFARYLRYVREIMRGISNICLWLFFFTGLDLKQKSSFLDGHE